MCGCPRRNVRPSNPAGGTSVAAIAADGKRVGLVGACVSDYPWIGELMKMLEDHGVEVSISSLRADSLTEGHASGAGHDHISGGGDSSCLSRTRTTSRTSSTSSMTASSR